MVSARFATLSKHAAKLVEIYCALCPDGMTSSDISDEDDNNDLASGDFLRKCLHRIGRPISTRFCTVFLKSLLLN